MEAEEIKKLLKFLHVGGWVLAAAIVIAGGAFVYRSILENAKLRLEIAQLQKDLKKD